MAGRFSAAIGAEPPLLAVLPGLITPEIANCLTGEVDLAESCIELGAGCWLVDPARRSVDAVQAGRLADRLSELVGGGLPMLAAVLQARSDTEVDPWLLVAQAAQQIGQGGDRLPHELLDRARTAMPTPGKAALCDLLGRSLDLVHGRFAEVAAQGPPPDALKPWLQGMLWHVHGWALTMSGQAAAALPALAHSRTILAESGTVDEYLSTLNIAALARLRAGDWDGAWAAELELQGLLAELPSPNYQLSYINAMNMARLQRRSNNLEGQREHFDRAFETARGLRSDSDGIHENVTRARLETAPEQARAAFLRAAVLLLSCRWPDAISPRILSALPRQDPAGEPRPAGSVEPEAGFVDVLARRLAGCLRAPNGRPLPAPVPGLTFRRAADLSAEVLEQADWRLYAVPGCLLAVAELPLLPVTSSPGLAELAGVVSGYLDLPPGATVLVDDRLGCEIPSDIWEIVAVAVRLGMRLTGGGRSLTADSGQRPALIAGARATLAPGVAALERDDAGRLIARFRRILPPLVLDEDASIVLLRLRDSPDASLLELAACLDSGHQESYRLLRKLEDARLIQLRY
ncbi:MAG: hypothetical protein M3Y42_00890 [Actinomycetota bacterium]|nr:hypothetical protein [Actinomycetota bacterium]